MSLGLWPVFSSPPCLWFLIACKAPQASLRAPSKSHYPDGNGIPLAFSLFPGNQNEQKSLKSLEQKVLTDFGHEKFIYCSDAGLASETDREFNHMGRRAFIVIQSIKKLPKEDRAWVLDRTRQIERAEKITASGKRKSERKNPNDLAKFVGKMAVTKEGEKAEIHYFLDMEKIAEETDIRVKKSLIP